MAAPPGSKFQTFDEANVVTILEGGLNTIYIVNPASDLEDKKLAVRVPKDHSDREKTKEAIQEEYRKIGASAVGIDFRLRSIEEQSQFMNLLAGLGLKTLASNALVGQEMVTDFMDGMPLSQYVRQDPSLIDATVIENVLTHLTDAHSAGVVFGDRWVNNTMILHDGTHKEFDFDIELIGEEDMTRAFELAQTLYHLIHFADGNRLLLSDTITRIYSENISLLTKYNMDAVLKLLEGHRDVFFREYQDSGSLYEGIVPADKEVTDLINQLQSIRQHTNKNQATHQTSALMEPVDV